MTDKSKGMLGKLALTTVELGKGVTDIRKANAEQKLADEFRKQLPGVVRSLKDNLTSATQMEESISRAAEEIPGIVQDVGTNLRSGVQLNEALTQTVKDTTDHVQQVAVSEILKNQTEEWTSVMNSRSFQTWTNIAGSMEGVAQSTDKVVKEAKGVQVFTKSLVD